VVPSVKIRALFGAVRNGTQWNLKARNFRKCRKKGDLRETMGKKRRQKKNFSCLSTPCRNTPTPQNTAFNNDAGAIRGAIQEILEKVRFLEDFIPNIS